MVSSSLWFGPLLWATLYASDYFLTLVCARLYLAGAGEKIVVGGSFELNPYYQKDIDSLRRVSPRFLWALCITLGGLAGGLVVGTSVPATKGTLCFHPGSAGSP